MAVIAKGVNPVFGRRIKFAVDACNATSPDQVYSRMIVRIMPSFLKPARLDLCSSIFSPHPRSRSIGSWCFSCSVRIAINMYQKNRPVRYPGQLLPDDGYALCFDQESRWMSYQLKHNSNAIRQAIAMLQIKPACHGSTE